MIFFFFNDTATTEIYTLSLHDALPISEHSPRLLLGLVVRGVRRVSLLPQELERSKEEPRPHLPAHDVRPLVDEQRQVAVALQDRKSTRLNSSHANISYAVFCLKKKKNK